MLPNALQATKGHNAILDMAQIISVLATCRLPEVHSAAFPLRKCCRMHFRQPTGCKDGDDLCHIKDRVMAFGCLLPRFHPRMDRLSSCLDAESVQPTMSNRDFIIPRLTDDSGVSIEQALL